MRQPCQYGETDSLPWWESAVHWHCLWRDGAQPKDGTTDRLQVSDQDLIRHFIWLPLLLSHVFCLVLGSKVEEGKKGGCFCVFLLNAISPRAVFCFFAATIATTRLSSSRQRGQQRAGRRPEQCHNRLSLNQASIRIHRLQERCSGRGRERRGAGGEGASGGRGGGGLPNRRKPAPIAETLPRQKW